MAPPSSTMLHPPPLPLCHRACATPVSTSLAFVCMGTAETGAAYYYNNWTGETTWEAPAGYYGYDGTYYGTYANQDAYYAEGGVGGAEAAYWQSAGRL